MAHKNPLSKIMFSVGVDRSSNSHVFDYVVEQMEHGRISGEFANAIIESFQGLQLPLVSKELISIVDASKISYSDARQMVAEHEHPELCMVVQRLEKVKVGDWPMQHVAVLLICFL